MHNQPFAQFETDRDTPLADPRQRLMWLGALAAACFFVVGARVAWIQAGMTDRFIAPWRETSATEEPIPSRDGRILSRDGVVLAYDETRYDLAVAYRWLESPPDRRWLREEVLRRLSPHERNDAVRRELVEREVLSERNRLWQTLSEVTGVPPEELARRRRTIQERIERMAASVEQRRAEGQDRHQAPTHAPLSQHGSETDRFRAILDLVWSELTTPPERISRDPIILREELEEHLLVRDLPFSQVSIVQSHPSRFPGVRIQGTASRVYPLEDLAAHVIGVRRRNAPAEGTLSETRAESGVERAYDRRLSGRHGLLRHTRDRRGQPLRSDVIREPQDGQDVVLTLDSRLQRSAEALLDAALAPADDDDEDSVLPTGGVIVAMDLWTGDVLTAAAAPRPSLSQMLHPDPQEWEELLADPRQPFFPRVTRMALPPGSVFKVVTAVAGLESGEVSPDELFHCRGYLDRPDRFRCLIYRKHGVGHGNVRLEDALCQSCNVFFYDLAERIGPQTLCDWAERFGFGQSTGSDLPLEQPGTLPRPETPVAQERWYPGTTRQLAIGQGALLATPLQVVRMMAAIGNGGYLVSPRVVVDSDASSAALDADRSPVPRPASIQKIPGLSERTLATVRSGLEMVVQHPRGTGSSARVEMVTLAGKTGTAEVAGRRDHAWFAGYVPARSPRIAYVVVLEHGGSAGEAAGGLVREFVQSLVEFGHIQPE
jgi:penicillin-binding protein 2